MSDIKVGDTPIKFVRVQSKRFLCGKCLDFCVEVIPVIKRGMGAVFFAQLREDRNRAMIEKRPWKNPMKVKIECGRGCHKSPWWHFNDVSMPKGQKFKANK